MAMTLMEALNNRKLQTQQTAEAKNTTQAVQKGLQTRATGKALGTGSSPSVTSTEEAAALDQTQAALNQLGTENQLQAQQNILQSQVQQSQQDQVQSDIVTKANQINSQLAFQENQLFSQLQREWTTLSEEQRQYGLERLASDMALQDRQYVDALQEEGTRRRLTDESEFRRALMQSQFAGMEKLLRDKVNFDALMAMDERAYTEALAKIDINSALQVANANAQAGALSTAGEGLNTILGSFLNMEKAK